MKIFLLLSAATIITGSLTPLVLSNKTTLMTLKTKIKKLKISVYDQDFHYYKSTEFHKAVRTTQYNYQIGIPVNDIKTIYENSWRYSYHLEDYTYTCAKYANEAPIWLTILYLYVNHSHFSNIENVTGISIPKFTARSGGRMFNKIMNTYETRQFVGAVKKLSTLSVPQLKTWNLYWANGGQVKWGIQCNFEDWFLYHRLTKKWYHKISFKVVTGNWSF